MLTLRLLLKNAIAGAVCLGAVGLAVTLDSQPPGAERPSQPVPNAIKENQAIFAKKLYPVFSHARCTNCHGRVNLVTGANHATGPAAQFSNCTTSGCHTPKEGFPPKEWQVAPESMSMAGKDARQACATLKTHVTAQQFFTIVQSDELIHWAFNPGGSRLPAPGGYANFLRNSEEWVKGGGYCPD